MYTSESRTRRDRIDPRIEAAGWRVAPFDPERPLDSYDQCAIEEFPTANGPADYALCIRNRILGVVEAKREGLAPQEVLRQAERYARGCTDNPFNFHGFRAPFLYSTNGERIWFRDVRHADSRSRELARFHTPSALAELLARDFDAACQDLLATPNAHPMLRPYQAEANASIERAIAQRKRTMLVAMATGTGKTFMCVNEIYRLIKSGVAKRILFLVDRRALAAQAVRAFAAFEPEPGLKFDKIYEVYSQRFFRGDFGEEAFDPSLLPAEYLTAPTPGHAFVYVSTIQRMAINLFGRDAIYGIGDEPLDEEASQLDIPIHAFDLIIADECHRGYTTQELSVWRNTLDHFDAIKLGLTATPAAHTKAYFNEVVFRYSFERAVQEGFLVDYDVVAIQSNVRIHGLFLKEGESVGMIDPESGLEQMDLLEGEREYDAAAVEREVTAPESNRLILGEIRKYAIEHEQRTGRFPKTLIFAVNDEPHRSHADQLVRLCRDVFGGGDEFVAKITGRADRPLQRIREFRNRPNPGIVVTVDMLSTGVDIPDLEFIVFLRPVKSRILFEQMMGRGTRKGDRHPDKSHFTVFDCFNGTLFEYFRQSTGITAEPPERPLRTIIELIDDIWNNRDREYNIRCLVKRLHRIDKDMSGEARELFAAFVPGGDLAQYARELPANLRKAFVDAMNLLRDKDFQRLLMDYPRAKRTFVVAYEAQDVVASEWLVRDAMGIEHKPEDYLELFARFVRENPNHIAAIEILINRPRDWSTDALKELRRKLAATRERFTPDNLQRAHHERYHRDLVDIISMIKHAAREEEPLLTAEERVAATLNRIQQGAAFTAEQLLWLDRIHQHLVQSLSISREDFDLIPILSRPGGWAPANRAFNGRLAELLRRINEVIAA